MEQLETPLKIRSHHLLCLLSFRGQGYSQKFVANMERVIKKLCSNPTSEVILVTEIDVICSACPHNKDDRCFKKADSEKKAKIQDLKIINKFGFRVGEKMPIDKAWREIKKKVVPQDLSKICHSCEWVEYCSCFPNFAI